ncbi:MAG: lipoprotein insertase outer membrane protein LolB, partial [Enterovibrio sp.]
MRRLCAAYLLLAIGILGCSAPPDNKPKQAVISSVWLAQQVKLEALRNFRLQGKMAFRSKSQRLGANFNWEQKGDDYSLRLTSFLGTSLLKLDAKDGVITVISEEGKKFKGDDANKLLRKLVGINLPLEQMIGWLKGLP